jgi:hypothetical protein
MAMPPIVVRDTQSGFVGATGTILTIEPDGRYIRAALVVQTAGEPLSEGVLGQAARDAIVRWTSTASRRSPIDWAGRAEQTRTRLR